MANITPLNYASRVGFEVQFVVNEASITLWADSQAGAQAWAQYARECWGLDTTPPVVRAPNRPGIWTTNVPLSDVAADKRVLHLMIAWMVQKLMATRPGPWWSRPES